MSQYSKRHWRYSLSLFALLMLVGCGAKQLAVTPDRSDEIGSLEAAESNLEEPQPTTSDERDSSFDDIYSSFTDEMAITEDSEATADDEALKAPLLEYLYSVSGGNDALASDLPSWVTGNRFMRFLQPSGFDLYDGDLYIVDSARQVMFRYQSDGEKIITVLDLKIYMRGDANSLAFSDKGYYFISEPLSSRILKFNKQNILVDVYKDRANLASPTKLYYDDSQKKLHVGDGVYSRIVVISERGKLLYALGGRGTANGEFTQVTDFATHNDNMIVIDRIGKKPMQVISNEGVFLHAYGRDVLDIPGAVAIDSQDRLYVADHSDDTIRVFVDGELRWRIGGSGTQPGKFRIVTQMKAYEGKLYVLDSLNRRIQVFQING